MYEKKSDHIKWHGNSINYSLNHSHCHADERANAKQWLLRSAGM